MRDKQQIPESSSVAHWYNQRYAAGQEQSFGRPPEESVRRLDKLDIAPNMRVLDVACGQGYFLKAAQEQGHHTFGIDIAIEAIRVARQVSPHSKTFVSSGEALPFPAHYFDVVTCWGSLEHHPDMEQALSEFIRVAKPAATIALRVPNSDFWLYRLGERLGRRAGTEQVDVIEHLLSLREWKALLKDAGLNIVRVTSDDWFLEQSFVKTPGLRARLLLLLRKLSLIAAPLPSTYVFDFLCKAPDS